MYNPPDHLKTLHSRRNRILVALMATVVLIIGLLFAFYQWSLSPVDSSDAGSVRLVIEPGDTAAVIADKLHDADLIKSPTSFRIYAELTNTKNSLQAGGYALSRNLSVADIIDHMSTGQTDEFDVSIVPGLTLKQQYDPGLQGSFADQGFSEAEITEAFNQPYDHPLLRTKPSDATLEGYIFPDTYRIAADDSLGSVLIKSFDELDELLTESGAEATLNQKGLTLHEGLTLASIIQKEVSNVPDQRQVAQVFLKRLAEDMPLGSDPTFIYAAELQGVEPRINIDSPYNTRVNGGIPPGPIANFNYSALQAVLDPASGDFLYFVADSSGTTRFSRTLEEHEAKVQEFSQDLADDFYY